MKEMKIIPKEDNEWRLFKMKRKITVLVMILMLVFSSTVRAAPPQNELNALLAELNWTQAELEEYLAFYEMSLNDFNSITELREVLGTPITSDNLLKLLDSYNMSMDELNELLAGFGESVNDYKFVEDLAFAIEFYQSHDVELKKLEKLLASVGLTENEVDRLFTHVISLDQMNIEQKMKQYEQQLAKYDHVLDTTKLTSAEQRELISIFEGVLSTLQLEQKYYLVKGTERVEISFTDLLQRESFGEYSLLIELYNADGEMVLDMLFSADMLTSGSILTIVKGFVQTAEMAGEMVSSMHGDRMPNTASPYVMQMVLSILLIAGGILLYRRNIPAKV